MSLKLKICALFLLSMGNELCWLLYRWLPNFTVCNFGVAWLGHFAIDSIHFYLIRIAVWPFLVNRHYIFCGNTAQTHTNVMSSIQPDYQGTKPLVFVEDSFQVHPWNLLTQVSDMHCSLLFHRSWRRGDSESIVLVLVCLGSDWAGSKGGVIDSWMGRRLSCNVNFQSRSVLRFVSGVVSSKRTNEVFFFKMVDPSLFIQSFLSLLGKSMETWCLISYLKS